MRVRLLALPLVVTLLVAGCSTDSSSSGGGWTGILQAPDAEPSDTAKRQPCDDPTGCFSRPKRTGTFDAGLVPEASGLAMSRRDPTLMWMVDDREGNNELWAVSIKGTLRAHFTVTGMNAVNAESLASGPCARGSEQSCLYIADIGDNARARDVVRILRVEEPDVVPYEGGSLPATVIELRYPDGPEDAEALLVDQDGVPYLINKARFDIKTGITAPTKLFAAPGFRDGLLQDLGPIPLPEPDPAVATLLLGNTVTGADSTIGRVLLRTYDQAVLFTAPSPDAALAGFAAWPWRRVPAPWQPQAEGVAFELGGCGYYSISESVGDIYFVPCTQ